MTSWDEWEDRGPAQGWEYCPGGMLERAGRNSDWFYCPSCMWVGWKQKHPSAAPRHQRPLVPGQLGLGI